MKNIITKIKTITKREYFTILLEVILASLVFILFNFLLVLMTSDAEFSMKFQNGFLFFKGEQISMGIKETIVFSLVLFVVFSWLKYRKKQKKANEMQE